MPTMLTIYQLKPAFQGLLRPLVARLAALGVTANAVTLLAMHRLGAGPLLLTLALPLEWLFLVLEPLIYVSTLVIKPRRWK